MAMTVAELMSAIEGLPDHWKVNVSQDRIEVLSCDAFKGEIIDVHSVEIVKLPHESITRVIIRM